MCALSWEAASASSVKPGGALIHPVRIPTALRPLACEAAQTDPRGEAMWRSPKTTWGDRAALPPPGPQLLLSLLQPPGDCNHMRSEARAAWLDPSPKSDRRHGER